MLKKSKICCIITIIVVYLTMFISSLCAQNRQEIEIIIDSLPGGDKENHYYKGEELREKFQFEAAIYEYQQVLSGGELCGLESKAHYNIGLCYTWLQLSDEARKTFMEVIQLYPKEDLAVAFAEYGIAWIDTREGYSASAIANHPYLDKLRGGPGLIKPAAGGAPLSPPITIDVLGLKFDYDHSSNTYDAVDIRVNYSSDIPVPEWTTFGETNEKMAYIKSSSSRKIKAQFWCDLANNYWKIGADVLNGTGFGNLPSIWVEIPSSHTSSYVTYTADGTVPGTVDIRNFRWNWYVWWGDDTRSLPKSSAAQKLSVETTGPHYYYTLLDWASGKSSSSQALNALTTTLYTNSELYYNGYQSHYKIYYNKCVFKLTDFLSDWYEADCQDCGMFLSTLSSSIGASLQQTRRIQGGFYTKSILPIGWSDYDWTTASWSFHHIAWLNNVYDACLKLKQSDPRIPINENIDDPYKIDLYNSGNWSLKTPFILGQQDPYWNRPSEIQ